MTFGLRVLFKSPISVFTKIVRFWNIRLATMQSGTVISARAEQSGNDVPSVSFYFVVKIRIFLICCQYVSKQILELSYVTFHVLFLYGRF
jgi:hypothetical protein